MVHAGNINAIAYGDGMKPPEDAMPVDQGDTGKERDIAKRGEKDKQTRMSRPYSE